MKNCESRSQNPEARSQKLAWGIFWLLATGYWLLCLPGCAPKAVPPAGYFGPTLPMKEVVEGINANNIAISSLWSRHYFEATIVDEKQKSHFVNGEGVLLYRSPNEMRIVGTKDIAGTIFEIGTTAERYWVMVVPELDTMWWGEYGRLDRLPPKRIPIRPDLILQVLGVSAVDADFLKEPAPVMRFNNDADAYMFVWNTRGKDRWIAQKEIWYDRATLLPKVVLLFDADGRIVLRAYLSKHRGVKVNGLAEGSGPKIATEYQLFFPDTKTHMSFELRDMALRHNGVPNANSIRFPREPEVSKVIQVDAEENH
jgi:hypothetical protein